MASWNHDGTQDPGPPPLMADPLSGLVTGGKYDAEAVRVRVVEPSMPDIDAVREAMASVLDEDSELRMTLPDALAEPMPEPNLGANDPDAGDGGTDVGPAASAAPVLPPALPPTPPVGIPVQRRGPMVPALIPARKRVRPPRPIRRGTFSPGLAAVGLLLLVIGVLVIVMLASLINTISSLFS
ncbi:MAG: hypothetical protein WBA97_30300 [Actinophytocola sp.]|uniref:hypothetical protein n=1 Tax=Actinophytocola sp. TaxID=1872138 RepID=UPI003C715921